ncbi:MAG: hypothetical protein JXR32_02530 [Anaerolineaceae bacterium]|nr:hypothetical protein [Anaerolineaceae bacterium]
MEVKTIGKHATTKLNLGELEELMSEENTASEIEEAEVEEAEVEEK